MLVNFAPTLKDTFYQAWSNANLSGQSPVQVFALRMEAPLFGANVPREPRYFTGDKNKDDGEDHEKGELAPQSKWKDWKLEDETPKGLFLDQAHEEITPLSYVVLQTPASDRSSKDTLERALYRVLDVQSSQRAAYGSTGKTTHLSLDREWWNPINEPDISQTLRKTLVFGQSEELKLVEEPVTDPVQVTEQDVLADKGIELGALYKEFTSGRWVVLSGERADIPGVSGVKGSELLMVSGLRHDFDANLPGDKIHTTLLFATPTAYAYERDTLVINGNVVKATHGETRDETLGSGDGSQRLQSFVLKQAPLTFVAAPNAAGVASTLRIYVNDIEWDEQDTLAGAGPKARGFVTKTDDADNTTVIFGNGEDGARLPTGVLNVKSIYRSGIGKPGNVRAEQISTLQSRPLGVKSVLNPLPASGGADKENRDQARENAPLAVMALDRLVSVQDYADFTRTFAGIAKASVRQLSDGRRGLIHLTIAGAADIPIDPVSDLYRNLVTALQTLGDLSVAVQVDLRELILLVLDARISLLPKYQWDPVATEIRSALLESFGFEKRALGQPALLCEIIGRIQRVEGVAYVDIDSFGGIPEKVADPVTGVRRLQTLDELTASANRIMTRTAGNADGGSSQGPAQRQAQGATQAVIANVADFEKGVLRPAQLAIFTPAVQDTIVLNQIK